MKAIEFESSRETVGAVAHYSEAIIKNEPMLFSCDFSHAQLLGGAITHEFLSAMPQSWIDAPDLIIDSRVHMLMKGWWPCIPGWHLDDVPRTRTDGQPDHSSPAYKAEHLMCLVGDCCPTVFLDGRISLEDVAVGESTEPIYGKWHREIEVALTSGCADASVVEAEECKLIRFGWGDFHRGQQAKKDGWRFFIRATRSTQRRPTNEVRRQVQVYLQAPTIGW